ncbi:hypothetical protein ACFQ0M_00810 [Kitasatospora aburaviensis]
MPVGAASTVAWRAGADGSAMSQIRTVPFSSTAATSVPRADAVMLRTGLPASPTTLFIREPARSYSCAEASRVGEVR